MSLSLRRFVVPIANTLFYLTVPQNYIILPIVTVRTDRIHSLYPLWKFKLTGIYCVGVGDSYSQETVILMLLF